MKEDNKKKLESMLSKHESKQKETEKRIRESNEEWKNFLDDFEKISNEVIKPVMEEIREILKSKGLDCFISYRREHKEEKGRTIASQIKMEIFPGERRSVLDNPPHISFLIDNFKKEIWIHENNIGWATGGTSGSKSNRYTIRSLTKDKAEMEIIESIGKILKIDSQL